MEHKSEVTLKTKLFNFTTMRKISQTITVTEFDSITDIDAKDKELLQQAISFAHKAYADYSNFHVGAAVLMHNGKVVCGNNQENVAYPSGLCAERVAVFAASAQYPGEQIDTIAVSAYSTKFEFSRPIPPCGSCRQAIAEYEVRQDTPIRLVLGGPKGKVHVVEGVSNLLPLMFFEEGLKRQ